MMLDAVLRKQGLFEAEQLVDDLKRWATASAVRRCIDRSATCRMRAS